jgi:hypothetical protein
MERNTETLSWVIRLINISTKILQIDRVLVELL